MKYELQKAMALFDARKARKSKNSENLVKMNTQKFAEALYPDMHPMTARSVVGRLQNGVKINPVVLREVVDFLGVDFNFMFGFPSLHDKEYIKLVVEK